MFTEREIIKIFDSCQHGDGSFLSNNAESLMTLRDIEEHSLLDVAITCRHAELTQQLLQIGFMKSSDDTRRAFTNAVEAGDLEIIKMLKEHADNYSNRSAEKSEFLNAALALASKLGHLEIVKYLLPDCHKEAVNTALLEAASEGHIPVLNALLAAGADSHLAPTGTFFDEVMRAHDTRCSDTLIALVDAGCVLNLYESAFDIGKNATVPLLQRIFARYPPTQKEMEKIVESVISFNNPDVLTWCLDDAKNRGHTLSAMKCMFMAVRPQPGTIDCMLDWFNVDTGKMAASLETAAQMNSVTLTNAALANSNHNAMDSSLLSDTHDPAVLRLMLESAGSIKWDGQGWKKRPVLTAACFNLKVESVKMLLAAGADPNAEGIPLRFAIRAPCAPDRIEDKIAVINALLDAGLNPEELLETLLAYCTSEIPQIDMIIVSLFRRRVWQGGITLMAKLVMDYAQKTSLMVALIEAGAIVRVKDKNGVSFAALLLCVYRGRTGREYQWARQSLRLLLLSGVDPAECSNDGTTLLMRAVQQWRDEDSVELCEIDDRASCMYVVDLVDALMVRIAAQ